MPSRRPRRLLISGAVTPADLSRTVINRYVTEGTRNLGNWAGNYQANIKAYLADTARQALAQQKLQVWYDIYFTEVYGKIKEAYSTARAEYIKRVYRPALPGGGIIPRPPA